MAADKPILPPRRLWTDLTTSDFQTHDVSGWIAVLPIAAVEQHGPHLPLGTDAVIGQGHLDRVIAALPDAIPAVFLPQQAIGKSDEHLAFPGTLSLSAETAIRVWTEILEGVARAGLRKLVIVNAHGGNVPVMDIVTRDLRVRHGLLAVHTSWSSFGYPDGLFDPDEVRLGIHGGDVETSLVQALRPEAVRDGERGDFRPASLEMQQSFRHLRTGRPAGFGWMAQDLHPSGAIGNTLPARADKGEAALDHAVARFIELLDDVHRFDLSRLAAGALD